ncbi:MAG: hypothetical protein HY677_03805, partial [Chloroflexi bacterium]|nr:hypothetical protein [Chloroflexota bacterium]
MLTKYDEYPLHQISDTFAAVQSGYQHWNDGHYICFCDMDGEISVVTTLRLYQNNDVMDGFSCVRHEGKQYNLRVSRRLRPAIDDFSVGPMRLEIIEPMKLVRLTVGENDFGVSMDIVCETAAAPYEDPISVSRVDGRLLSERAVYEVVGRLEGHVTVNGKRYNVTKDRWYCFRNHSWGFMPGRGGPRQHAAPPLVPPARQQGLRNWVLYLMSDYGGFYQFSEDPKGKRRSMEGEILTPTWDRTQPKVKFVDAKHDLQFYGTTRRLKGGSI